MAALKAAKKAKQVKPLDDQEDVQESDHSKSEEMETDQAKIDNAKSAEMEIDQPEAEVEMRPSTSQSTGSRIVNFTRLKSGRFSKRKSLERSSLGRFKSSSEQT